MKNLESVIENDVVSYVQNILGVRSLKLNIQGNNGWPDRMFLLPSGRPLFIEFKRPGEKPRPLQNSKIKILSKLGYDVETHDTYLTAVLSIEKKLQDAYPRKYVGSGAKTLEATRLPEEGS